MITHLWFVNWVSDRIELKVNMRILLHANAFQIVDHLVKGIHQSLVDSCYTEPKIWCFLCCYFEPAVENMVELLVTVLSHRGCVKHIRISKLAIIGLDNVLSPDWRQAIIWTNAGILLIGPLGTNFSERLIEIHTFSFKKMHLKRLFGKWWPFCLVLNGVLTLSWCYLTEFLIDMLPL